MNVAKLYDGPTHFGIREMSSNNSHASHMVQSSQDRPKPESPAASDAFFYSGANVKSITSEAQNRQHTKVHSERDNGVSEATAELGTCMPARRGMSPSGSKDP